MDRGWTPLWRKSDESAIFQDANLWRLWTWLLIRAAYEKTFATLSTGRGEVVVPLEPGQCVVGRHKSAEALGWPSSTFRNRLEKLTKAPFECITIQKDTHFSIVTIVKWKAYADAAKKKGQAKDKQRTSKGHKEELKELKKEYSEVFQNGFWRAWEEWEIFRREKKQTLTLTTIKKQLKKLSSMTEDKAIATLEQSMEKGWIGLFPEKVQGGQERSFRREPKYLGDA